MNYIFIDSAEDCEKVGIVEENKLVEFYTDEKDNTQSVGDIYRGKVANVLPGMEAAFVDIGEGKNGYLYIKDALPKDKMYKRIRINIKEIIKSGEDIIVQVLKESSGNKGPKVTTHITLPGRFLVLTPFSNKTNISRKIINSKERDRLKEAGDEIQVDGIGVIFRTKSRGVEKELLLAEYNSLVKIYQKIEREKNFLPCPKLLYKEMDLAHQIVRDTPSANVDKIIINEKEKYHSLLSFQDIISPKLNEKLTYDEDFNVSYNEDIGTQINDALKRIVPLESGGYIVIDETEALIAIDVNTGKFIGSKNLEDTVVQTNLEAAEEIAKQIRLRDLGGIIIIDLIDMRVQKDTDMVLDKLYEFLCLDRNKANIIGFTKLGLVELTRKKTRASLRTQFVKKCPHCRGTGIER